MVKKNKPKVAIRSITGCAGCQLSIYFIEDILLNLLEEIDLVAAPMIKEANFDGPVDICFIEGSVTFNEDIDQILKWRKDSNIIIALGACATDGGVQQQKKFIEKGTAEKYVYRGKTKHLKIVDPTPISDHIKVDFEIKGCPADKEEILWTLKQMLIGKLPSRANHSVCHECKLLENNCLLDQGRDCYGPVTNGNCSIMCPSFNHACTGCRGPFEDSNFKQHIELLKEKGLDEKLILSRMRKYGGLKMERLIEEQK